MVRRYLGHMTDPRSRRTNHKAQRFSRMRTGHPAVRRAPTLQKPGRQRTAG
ncbi:unnamed protein product [Staurois parvus]|uniref:Uncharacterized protein n=1 Tax=Staurois parvus TaxID=386267 RepID=A0ABN9CEZ9_9NEOB|nr:unnamed protein product [Staurois parvus]